MENRELEREYLQLLWNCNQIPQFQILINVAAIVFVELKRLTCDDNIEGCAESK